jgi:hypothetical protein
MATHDALQLTDGVGLEFLLRVAKQSDHVLLVEEGSLSPSTYVGIMKLEERGLIRMEPRLNLERNEIRERYTLTRKGTQVYRMIVAAFTEAYARKKTRA